MMIFPSPCVCMSIGARSPRTSCVASSEAGGVIKEGVIREGVIKEEVREEEVREEEEDDEMKREQRKVLK